MEAEIRVIQTTLPGKWIEPEVAAFCQSILEAGAACTQHSKIQSMYKWEDEFQSESEWRIQIKVNQVNAQNVHAKIEQLHPYQIPQILSWNAEANDEYKAWTTSS